VNTSDVPRAASHAGSGDERVRRREQVRSRVEAVLGKHLQEFGPDYRLPDGRIVAIYYSKIHKRGNVYLGISNRIRDEDVIVLLLGDESHPEHLVFPRAEALLRYRDCFTSPRGNRMAPPIWVSNGSFVLRKRAKGLSVLLDDRINAYHELLCPVGDTAVTAGVTTIGRDFVEDDDTVVPRAAAPSWVDPDLVGRGNRAHKQTRNALAAHLQSLGVRPLDPDSCDPPFDLAWLMGGVLYVAEVKSLTRENEEHQLRLGLGQVLRYCHLLRDRAEDVIPVLVPESEPRDPEWKKLCAALNGRLAFPPYFMDLIDERACDER
jgi:hypothetical protein